MMGRRGTRPLRGARCAHGHVHFPPEARCPACGAPATVTRLSSRAVLVLVTTVRVNPSGAPFRLGVAVTRSGHARVLCRVAGLVRGSGRDRVALEDQEGVVVARPWRRRR